MTLFEIIWMMEQALRVGLEPRLRRIECAPGVPAALVKASGAVKAGSAYGIDAFMGVPMQVADLAPGEWVGYDQFGTEIRRGNLSALLSDHDQLPYGVYGVVR